MTQSTLFESDDTATTLVDHMHTLPDAAILETLLRPSMTRAAAATTAARLLQQFKTLANVISAPVSTLRNVADLDARTLTALKITQVAAVRLARHDVQDQPVISSWDKLVGYLTAASGRIAHEEVRVLLLDRKNRLIADVPHARGTVDQTALYTREVIRAALDHGASAIILTHNHPSGNTTPSQQDIDSTRELKEACKHIGIALHDHVIVGQSDNFSFRATGLL